MGQVGRHPVPSPLGCTPRPRALACPWCYRPLKASSSLGSGALGGALQTANKDSLPERRRGPASPVLWGWGWKACATTARSRGSWQVTEQSGTRKGSTFIHQQETRVGLDTQGGIHGPCLAFRPLSGSSYGVRKSEVGGHHWVLQPLPRQGARGQALHVCAELEKEEEEGHHQSTHQDVLEEPRVGTCQTRKRKWGPWTGLLGLLSSRPWQGGGPLLKLVHT